MQETTSHCNYSYVGLVNVTRLLYVAIAAIASPLMFYSYKWLVHGY